MLTAGPAKTRQNVTSGVVTSCLSQGSDWPTHGLVGNRNESHGNLFHIQRVFLCTVFLGRQKFIDLVLDNKFLRLY